MEPASASLSSPFQLSANALLFVGVNMYGVFVRVLAERSQRRAFLLARNCIEDRLKLEDENEKQVGARSPFRDRGHGGWGGIGPQPGRGCWRDMHWFWEGVLGTRPILGGVAGACALVLGGRTPLWMGVLGDVRCHGRGCWGPSSALTTVWGRSAHQLLQVAGHVGLGLEGLGTGSWSGWSLGGEGTAAWGTFLVRGGGPLICCGLSGGDWRS